MKRVSPEFKHQPPSFSEGIIPTPLNSCTSKPCVLSLISNVSFKATILSHCMKTCMV